MKNTKTILGALLLAGASLASSAVLAADISKPEQALTMIDGAASFGDAFGNANRGNTFADKFTFSISATSNFDTLVSSISPSAANGLAITSLGLYSMNGLVASGTQLQTGKIDLWSLNIQSLAAGSYYIQVGGSAMSGASSSYGGSLTTAAVPEPATYGMMLGGLGLLGLMSRRRKNAA